MLDLDDTEQITFLIDDHTWAVGEVVIAYDARTQRRFVEVKDFALFVMIEGIEQHVSLSPAMMAYYEEKFKEYALEQD